MPLHLLGKKSWNVYNADNIARVQRDEAEAKAKEEAEEQRMQELDAQRRMAILRGEVPPPLPEPEPEDDKLTTPREAHSRGPRKKRKRPGEDDTDFELRLASERFEPTENRVEERKSTSSSAPITDHAGHIDLFGDDGARSRNEKNEEAEKEKKKKKQEYEDQYQMRFVNAEGKNGTRDPWYSKSGVGEELERTMKDVWGNEDPRRKDRDTQRIVSNDPLAMMKKGASKVRELKQERKKVQDDRDEDLRQLRKEQSRKERHRRRDEDRSRGRSPHDSRRRHKSRDRHQDDDGPHGRERERSRRHGDSEENRRHRRRSRSPEHRRHRHRHEI